MLCSQIIMAAEEGASTQFNDEMQVDSTDAFLNTVGAPMSPVAVARSADMGSPNANLEWTPSSVRAGALCPLSPTPTCLTCRPEEQQQVIICKACLLSSEEFGAKMAP